MSVTRSSPVVTKWVTIMSALTGQSRVQIVPTCPVQIGAHHHINVYTDINECSCVYQSNYFHFSTIQIHNIYLI